MAIMNEHLLERTKRSSRNQHSRNDQADVWILPPRLNTGIREYVEMDVAAVSSSQWLQQPEVPSSAEILDIDVSISTASGVSEITPNRPVGAWEHKEEYLAAQYELLRRDAVRPLRDAVSQVRITPAANEETFNGVIGIYEKVHVTAITCSTKGIAVRISFSIIRVGKNIRWDQSNRLISGSLVVLTPVDDMFKTKAIVATVAARPQAGLAQNPPEIDLLFGCTDDLEIDPALEYVMVEDRSGYYQADKHTLKALQHIMSEPFPLAQHLVAANRVVQPPQYLQAHPLTDMTAVLINNRHQTYENVDILANWPAQPQSPLDASQLAALRRILTKRLAIVQGPPGTGKTHVSVQALKVMLANRKADDPPIIVTCQTNHALDQLLRHIAVFEKDFLRLGGQTKDRGIIKARTLFEVQKSNPEPPVSGGYRRGAVTAMKKVEKEIELILSPLKPGKLPLDPKLLRAFGLLTEQQIISLEAGASQWTQKELSNPNDADNPFTLWISKALITVPLKQQPEEFGFEFEEADLAFEHLKETEAEAFAKDDEDFESLFGNTYPLADNFAGRKIVGMNDQKITNLLKEKDLWKIPEQLRGAVYNHLQRQAKKIVVAKFREKAKEYALQAGKRLIGKWEQDEQTLKSQKIIGLTTTGFSKYRAVIAALKPKIVLIEEAGETLEAPVIATCVPSLQQLVLVGDHKQLRPHCHMKDHEDKPYYLNVSLFERMINNGVEFDTLSKQRRMIPEIRRILYPIYGDLITDHASVLNPANRPEVPGMGGVNSFFFTHTWPEQRDQYMSSVNPDEADMIVGFMEYLVYNGMKAEDITVLTFYNGQRKRLLSDLHKSIILSGASLERRTFNVVTVDSYQGEENKVVLLSLVRNNDKGQIGFLSVANRVCVALSRAQCGFYIFGNGQTMWTNELWQKVIKVMAGHKNKKERPRILLGRVDEKLPTRCSNHNALTLIADSSDWTKINGGCALKCDGMLPCGHKCELTCHPFPHDAIPCHQPCQKILSCGHRCSGECGNISCHCEICTKGRGASSELAPVLHKRIESLSHSSSSTSWHSFAETEPARYAVAASAPMSRRSTPKKNQQPDLLEPDEADSLAMPMQNFGLDGGDAPTVHAADTALIPAKHDSDGTRKKWKETFVLASTQVVKQEEDLIDLSF